MHLTLSDTFVLSKHLKAGHCRSASETSFEWRFAGGPIWTHYCLLTGYRQNCICQPLHVGVLSIVCDESNNLSYVLYRVNLP